MKDRVMAAWYRIVWLLAKALFSIICSIEIHGGPDVPEKGPFIVATNHLQFFDPPLVLIGLPFRRMTVLAADKWAKSWPIGWFLSSMGAIFVQRGEVDRVALSKCQAVLQRGGILGVAPEGTRSPTGGLQRGKTGVAYIAVKADVPILPVGVSGQEKIIAEWKHLHRAHIVIRIGQPFKLPPLHGGHKGQQLQALTDEVMYHIAALLREDLRGVYADAVHDRAGLSA
jgi:1-acyl-sn-glycerol-3-phosphate acyltransferase